MKIAPRRSIVVIIFGLFLAASLLLLNSSSDSAQATGNYSPTYSMKLCNGLSSIFVDASLQGNSGCTNPLPTTGAARTITINNTLPVGDLQFSAVTYFEPNEVAITPGCNIDTNADNILDGRDFDGNGTDDVAGACLRPGDKVGGLRNAVSLGILNGPCSQFGLTVDFVLYNIALPNDASNPRNSTNIYTPGPEGTGSDTRFSTDGGQSPGAGFVDTNTDTLADVDPSNPTDDSVSSQAITNYPDWLLDIFDPDWLPVNPPIAIEGPADPLNSGGVGNSTGAGDTRANSVDGPKKPLIPLVVYGGFTNVAGSKTPLYFVQFDDGVLGSDNTDGFASPHPFAMAVGTLGQPYTTILTDTTPIILGTSPISDFCTGLLTTIMLKGTTVTDSVTRASNPTTAGSQPGLVWSASQRDLDNDTLEAQIDTCPADFNTDTDPRDTVGNVNTSDPDGDMVDAACDLDAGNPGCNSGADPAGVDLLGGDDCDGDGWLNALDNCPLVSNVNQTQSELLTAYSATAPDGGPKSDGIGDACESGSWTGTQNGVTGVSVTLSSTVSNGHYHVSGVVMPICYDTPTPSKTDADGDGWCAGSGEDDSSALLHPKLDLFVIGGDHDGDGVNAWLETFMGIDDATPCSATTTKGDETIGSFMSDFDDSRKTDIFDIIFLKPSFFKKANQAGYLNRVDMDGSTKVDIFDIIKLKPNFFQTCSFTPQQ